MSGLETTVRKILQMGKQRLERGRDLARGTPPGRGRPEPTATWRVGPAPRLRPPDSRCAQGGKSVGGSERIPWISKSPELPLEGRRPSLPRTPTWASAEDDVGVPAPEGEPRLPPSRQPPLQPPPQARPHPQNIGLGWAELG